MSEIEMKIKEIEIDREESIISRVLSEYPEDESSIDRMRVTVEYSQMLNLVAKIKGLKRGNRRLAAELSKFSSYPENFSEFEQQVQRREKIMQEEIASLKKLVKTYSEEIVERKNIMKDNADLIEKIKEEIEEHKAETIKIKALMFDAIQKNPEALNKMISDIVETMAKRKPIFILGKNNEEDKYDPQGVSKITFTWSGDHMNWKISNIKTR